MSKADEALQLLGSIVAALMITNPAARIGPQQIRFDCGVSEFESSVTNAVHSALATVPFGMLIDILYEVQRRQVRRSQHTSVFDPGLKEAMSKLRIVN